MKKIFFSGLLFLSAVGILTGFTGCSQEAYSPNEGVNVLPKDISAKYVAPSGDVLFVDDAAFTASTSKVLTDTYGKDAEKCLIVDIEFADIAKGYVATVEYINPDGKKANYVMTNVPFSFEGGKLELEEKPLKTRNRLKSASDPLKIKSLAIVPTKGNRVDVKTDGNIFKYSCQGDAVMKYDFK